MGEVRGAEGPSPLPRTQTPPNPGSKHHPTTQGKEAPPTQREASALSEVVLLSHQAADSELLRSGERKGDTRPRNKAGSTQNSSPSQSSMEPHPIPAVTS